MIKHLLLFSLIVAYIPIICEMRFTLKYIKGFEETRTKYPFLVALLHHKKVRECTGTLLGPEWVLTAAHCLMNYYITNICVLLDQKQKRVLENLPHPNYDLGKINNIALLRVEPVHINFFGRLTTVDYKKLIGRYVEFTRFGVRTAVIKETSNALEVIPLYETRPLFIKKGIMRKCDSVALHRNFICVVMMAHEKYLPDLIFPEDSGGPLFSDERIIGISNWASTDNSTIPKALYTPINIYSSWIQTTIRKVNYHNYFHHHHFIPHPNYYQL